MIDPIKKNKKHMKALKSTIFQKVHSLIKKKLENIKTLMILGSSARFQKRNLYANITIQMKIHTKTKK